MDTLQNLKAFLAVAGSGSFSAAARSLGTVPSVVMKRIDQLEWRAKVTLFARSTRKVSLTEAGKRSLPRLRAAVNELDDVLQAMSRPPRDLEGHLRIKVPTTLGVLYLGSILGRFQAKHPRVSLDMVLTHRALNPADEGFDLAIGAFPTSFRGVVDTPLYPLRRMVCATPEYLTARGTPQQPLDLTAHETLNFLPSGTTWTFRSDRGSIAVDLAPRLNTNDNQVLLASALAGVGVALLPEYVVLPSIRAGALRQVLEGFSLPEMWLKTLVPENRMQVPQVRALIDFLAECFDPLPPWERT